MTTTAATREVLINLRARHGQRDLIDRAAEARRALWAQVPSPGNSALRCIDSVNTEPYSHCQHTEQSP